MEDDLKRNGRRPQKKWKTTSKKNEDEPINLIGCDTIVNSPSYSFKSLTVTTKVTPVHKFHLFNAWSWLVSQTY